MRASLPVSVLALITSVLTCIDPNGTLSINETSSTPTIIAVPGCHTVYPSGLRLLDSWYPDMVLAPEMFNMVVRTSDDSLQVATEIQFVDIPDEAYACQLELLVPGDSLMRIYGPSPIVNIYLVKRVAGDYATWSTYQGANGTGIWGTLNMESWNTTDVRGTGIVVNTAACERTLTFQVGFQSPGGLPLNYWEFRQINPPAAPTQGWRIVHSC